MRNKLMGLWIGMCMCTFAGRAQILQELQPEQLKVYIEGLLKDGREVEAMDQFYRYCSFLPTYNQRMRAADLIQELTAQLNEASKARMGMPPEVEYGLWIPVLQQCVQEERVQDGLALLLRFKEHVPEAKAQFDAWMALPVDTLQLTAPQLPYQLYRENGDRSYHLQQLLFFDSARVYVQKDSSVYKGVILSRECAPEHMETGIARLTYDHYVQGRLAARKIQAFTPSHLLHANKVFFGHDSSHYQCITETFIDLGDTVRTRTFASDWLYMEEYALKTPQGYLEPVRNIVYREDGSIALWQTKTVPTEAQQAYDYYECWVGQNGDTLYEAYELNRGDQIITLERRLNAEGDTVMLLRTVDGLMDGLQVEQYATDPDGSLRFRCVRNAVEDILTPEIIYFDGAWNITDEAHFLEEVNQLEFPGGALVLGDLRAYFPEYEWLGDPVFLTAALPFARKDKRHFRKSCVAALHPQKKK